MERKMRLVDNVSGEELKWGDPVTSAKNGETYTYRGLHYSNGRTLVTVAGRREQGQAGLHRVSPESLDTRVENAGSWLARQWTLWLTPQSKPRNERVKRLAIDLAIGVGLFVVLVVLF